MPTERLSGTEVGGGGEAPDGHFQSPQQRTHGILGNTSREGQ